MADGKMADNKWQDGRWQMARWQMADGRWQMADGRWQMADGRWQDDRWGMTKNESVAAYGTFIHLPFPNPKSKIKMVRL